MNALWRYVAVILIAVASFGVIVFNGRGNTIEKLEKENATLSTNLTAVSNTAAVTEAVLTDLAESKPRIRTLTKEIVREVPTRIPSDACQLDPDWRLLHDSAAEGVLPEATGGVDETPVTAQDAATTVIENYGICAENADQLVKLQTWIKGVSE